MSVNYFLLSGIVICVMVEVIKMVNIELTEHNKITLSSLIVETIFNYNSRIKDLKTKAQETEYESIIILYESEIKELEEILGKLK